MLNPLFVEKGEGGAQTQLSDSCRARTSCHGDVDFSLAHAWDTQPPAQTVSVRPGHWGTPVHPSILSTAICRRLAVPGPGGGAWGETGRRGQTAGDRGQRTQLVQTLGSGLPEGLDREHLAAEGCVSHFLGLARRWDAGPTVGRQNGPGSEW